ncbi:MAG: hypothetical protein WD749_00720 [Phycisphaerales bacterium]
MRSVPKAVLAAATLLGCGAAAQADLIYSNTFENAGVPVPEWSSNATFTSAAPFTRFLGRYGGIDSVTLTLNIPTDDTGGTGGGGTGGGTGGGGGGTQRLYTLLFDLYPIDTWDGHEPNFGPDAFQVYINGSLHFNHTIANQHGLQSFRPPDLGPAPMAFGSANDSIYRDIAISFTLDPAATELKFKFRSQLTQTLADESWGIDNVRVNYTVVPSAGTCVLLALGGLVAARRKR